MTKKVTLAQICHVFLPHMGGTELIADRTYTKLKENGIDSVILATDHGSSMKGRKEYAFYAKTTFSFMGNPFSIEMMNFLRKNSYDIIQIQSLWFFSSFMAILFRKDAKVITTVHGVFPDNLTPVQSFFLNLYKPFVAYVLNQSDEIIVQTESEREKIYKIFHLKNKKVHIIPYGIELESDRSRIPQEIKTLLFTGRIIPDKNPELLIKAGSILNDKGFDFTIKFIGPVEETYKQDLVKLSKILKIPEKVIFLPNIPQEERKLLMEEYAKSFIFISIGSWEGLPNRIMEAMQFGVPCVTYDSGGTGELVIEGKTGFLIKKLDETELEEKIEILFRNRDLYETIGKNARLHIEKNFNWNNNFKEILKLYIEA